jgi:hypothetical protein
LDNEEKAITKLINADERKKLQDKPITLAVHKELQEIHDRLKDITEAEEKLLEKRLDDRLDEQRKAYEQKLDLAVKHAKEEGLRQGRKEKAEEGTQKVECLLKFLRLAGFRRSIKSENVAEDDAIEQVLVLVYSGDVDAMSAAIKLAEGSNDVVGDDHRVTCKFEPKSNKVI